MPNLRELENAIPIAPLKIVALDSAKEFGEMVNKHLVFYRKEVDINNAVKEDPAFNGYIEDNYLADFDVPRFGSGEGKGVFHESIR